MGECKSKPRFASEVTNRGLKWLFLVQKWVLPGMAGVNLAGDMSLGMAPGAAVGWKHEAEHSGYFSKH